MMHVFVMYNLGYRLTLGVGSSALIWDYNLLISAPITFENSIIHEFASFLLEFLLQFPYLNLF